MPSFAYKFYYNSESVGFSDGLGFFRKEAKADRFPSIDGYTAGDELTLAWAGAIDVEVGGDDQGAVEKFVCEKIWYLFNAPWERPAEYAGPSMNVGDVVVLTVGDTEVAYTVEGVGFKRVPDGIIAISNIMHPFKPQPTRWVRTPEQLKGYLLAKRDDGEFLTEAEEAIAYGGR